jgi:hypothetical protein
LFRIWVRWVGSTKVVVQSESTPFPCLAVMVVAAADHECVLLLAANSSKARRKGSGSVRRRLSALRKIPLAALGLKLRKVAITTSPQ